MILQFSSIHPTKGKDSNFLPGPTQFITHYHAIIWHNMDRLTDIDINFLYNTVQAQKNTNTFMRYLRVPIGQCHHDIESG
jgi:hypothetical protein